MATLVREWEEEQEMSGSTAFSQQQGAQRPCSQAVPLHLLSKGSSSDR